MPHHPPTAPAPSSIFARGPLVSAVGLLLLFLALTALRLAPVWNQRVELREDALFHQRMVLEVLEHGAVPAVDRLSLHPQGKPIRQLVPSGLHQVGALFCRAAKLVSGAPVDRALLYYCALAGASIVFPVYFLALILHHERWLAFAVAALAGVIPAYLARSMSYRIRYETLATPILFASLMFFIKSFQSADWRRAGAWAGASAGCLLLGLWVWRLAALFVIGFALALVVVTFRQRALPRARLVQAAALTGVVVFARIAFPWFGSGGMGGDFTRATVEIALQNLGVQESLSDYARLLSTTKELASVGLSELAGASFLSWSVVFVVAFTWRFLTDRSRRPERDALFAVIAFYLVLTLVFARSKSILGPLAALAAGESVAFARRLGRPAWRAVLLAALTAAAAKTAYDGVTYAAPGPTHTRMDPLMKQALRAINDRTPPDSVFLCYWDEGFFIQSYCGRPTLTDGLLEDRENLRRIIDESRAYYSPNEDDLWRLARQHGATHVLVPTNKKFAYSVCAGVDMESYFREGRSTELGRRTTLYKALRAPEQLSRFEEIYRNERFVLFTVR